MTDNEKKVYERLMKYRFDLFRYAPQSHQYARWLALVEDKKLFETALIKIRQLRGKQKTDGTAQRIAREALK